MRLNWNNIGRGLTDVAIVRIEQLYYVSCAKKDRTACLFKPGK